MGLLWLTRTIAKFYGIRGADEAIAYLEHPVLGQACWVVVTC